MVEQEQTEDQTAGKMAGLDQSEMVELPAVDMSLPDEEIIPQLMEMMSGLGFLHLKNVEGFDEDELLQDVIDFHAVDDNSKL